MATPRYNVPIPIPDHHSTIDPNTDPNSIWPSILGPPPDTTPFVGPVSAPAPISPVPIGYETVSGTSYDPTFQSAPTEALYTLGPSAFQHLSIDPTTRAAQMEALGMMQESLRGGGFSPEERANLEAVLLAQRQAQTAGAQGAYQEAERRGLGTSATALAASLFASQQEAQTEFQQGLQVESQEMARKLQLETSIGSLAGSIQSQDYKMAADRAQAIDAINQFNINNKQQWAARAANREQTALSANQSAQNSAKQFAAQTAFDAANANANRALTAAQHNSSQSFTAEQYNSNMAWAQTTFNAGLSMQDQQAAANQAWQKYNAATNIWQTYINRPEATPGAPIPGAQPPQQPQQPPQQPEPPPGGADVNGLLPGQVPSANMPGGAG